MRVAMVSPYSLSRPGGVQGQVTGLARALRRLGPRGASLAPDDGRARAGEARRRVVVVGRSTGVRANGSVAPVALRRRRRLAGRAVRPAAPGRRRAPARAAGPGGRLRLPAAPAGARWWAPSTAPGRARGTGCSAAGPLGGRAARRALRGLRGGPGHRGGDLGGDYEVLFNGVDVERFADAGPGRPTSRRSSSSGATRTARAWASCSDAFAAVPGPGAAVGGRATGPRPPSCDRRHPPSARVQWLGRAAPTTSWRARLAGADVLCAPSLGGESFGMVLLEAMAAGCAVVASDLPGYRAGRRRARAALVPPGDPARWPAPCGGAGRRRPDRAARRSPARGPGGLSAHAERWSMDAAGRAATSRSTGEPPSGSVRPRRGPPVAGYPERAMRRLPSSSDAARRRRRPEPAGPPGSRVAARAGVGPAPGTSGPRSGGSRSGRLAVDQRRRTSVGRPGRAATVRASRRPGGGRSVGRGPAPGAPAAGPAVVAARSEPAVAAVVEAGDRRRGRAAEPAAGRAAGRGAAGVRARPGASG